MPVLNKYDTKHKSFIKMQKRSQELQEELDKIQHQLETRTDYETDDYMNLSQLFCDINDRLVHLDIDDKDKKTELVLLGLGYQREDFEKAPSTFSGGWAMRLELSKLLLQNPDLLIFPILFVHFLQFGLFSLLLISFSIFSLIKKFKLSQSFFCSSPVFNLSYVSFPFLVGSINKEGLFLLNE